MKMLRLRSLVLSLCISLSCVTRAAQLVIVSGYEGQAVNISCSYGVGYQSYEKYLCRGECGDSDVLVTTTGAKKNRYSISDDKQKRVFTTTISDLSQTDVGRYWCGVSRSGKDIYTEVKLEVGQDSCCDGSTRLQSYEESSVSFRCPYGPKDQNNLKYLCRGKQPSTCLQQALITSNEQQKGRFNLSDNKRSREFTVTMTSLTQEDSGSYLCGVQRNPRLDVFTAVDLEVKEWCCVTSSELSGIVGGQVTMQCPYSPQHKNKKEFICKGDHRRSCADMMSQSRFSLQENVSLSSFSVRIIELKAEDAGTYLCGSDPQWRVGNYTKIHLSVDFPDQITTVGTVPVETKPTSVPDKNVTDRGGDATHVLPMGVILPTVCGVVLLMLTFASVIICTYKSRTAQGAEVSVNRNQTKKAEAQVVISEADNRDADVHPRQETPKQPRTCHQDDEDSVYQNFCKTGDIHLNQLYATAKK